MFILHFEMVNYFALMVSLCVSYITNMMRQIYSDGETGADRR